MAKELAETEHTILLRTHFGDDAAWKDLCAAVEQRVGEYRAYVTPVNDPQYASLTAEQIVKIAEANHTFVLVADEEAFTKKEHAVLVVDVCDEPGRTFRVIPREAWSVENNLSISNMDFADFADAVEEDGVFRGFRE